MVFTIGMIGKKASHIASNFTGLVAELLANELLATQHQQHEGAAALCAAVSMCETLLKPENKVRAIIKDSLCQMLTSQSFFSCVHACVIIFIVLCIAIAPNS